MSFWIVKLLDEFEPRRSVNVIVVFQFECLETSKISDDKQCVLHNLSMSNCFGVPVPFLWARTLVLNLTQIRAMGMAKIETSRDFRGSKF